MKQRYVPMPAGMRFRATREFILSDGISLHLWSQFNTPGDVPQRAVAEPVVMRALTEKDDGVPIQPFLHLNVEVAQQLMDELWSVGLRPTEGTGSAGALAATQRHLEDMKTVAFHALKIGKDTKG